MPLFKSKPDEPAQAPPASDPPVDGAVTTPPEQTYVTTEQFNTLQASIGTMAESIKVMSDNTYRQPATPVAPPEDPHKDQKARIAQIDTALADLTKKADDAQYQGKLGTILADQNKLMLERGELQGQMMAGQTDPRIDAGMATIDAIASKVVSSDMPYLNIKEVKDRYEYYSNQLPVDQRMNPEAKMGAYNLAVGENQVVLEEVKKQEWLREQDEATQDPLAGAASGRQEQRAPNGGIPAPNQILSTEAMRSIKGSRHRTPDNYYRSLGYEGGWEDYYEKNKEYLNEEEGENA